MTGQDLTRLAPFGARVLAFVVDSVVVIVVALLSGFRPGTPSYGLFVYLAFLLLELVLVSTTGQTIGMRVARIVVVSATDGSRPKPWWVLVRTLLLAVVLPALFTDSTGRSLHDRAAGTVTVQLPG